MCNATPIERWIIVPCLADWLTDWLSERAGGKYANFGTDATTLFPISQAFPNSPTAANTNGKTIKLWMLCCAMLVAWNLLPCCDKRDGEALSPQSPLRETTGHFKWQLHIWFVWVCARPAGQQQQANRLMCLLGVWVMWQAIRTTQIVRGVKAKVATCK